MSGDTFYSLTLGLAMIAAVLAVALGAVASRSPNGGTGALYSWASRADRAALGLTVLSLLAHIVFGHRPGTESALSFFAFLREHPAFVVLIGLTLVLFPYFRHRARRTISDA